MKLSVKDECRITAQKLDKLCEAQPFEVRFMIRDLRTGAQIERMSDVLTPAASTRKIAIMMAVLKAASDGRLDLAERFPNRCDLREEVASGIFRYLSSETTISLSDALTGMIALSDNVCTKMVMERITLDEVQQYCTDLGMNDTCHRNTIPPLSLAPDHPLDAITTTTAADQERLLKAILDGRESPEAARRIGCTQELAEFALDTLRKQVFRYGIRSRLPFDTVAGSKGGRGKRGRMDSGIVYSGGQPLFTAAIYTDGVPQIMPEGTPGYTLALETIGRIAKICWDDLRDSDGRQSAMRPADRDGTNQS